MGHQSKWPNGAKTAIALTLDNCGEAADLNRGTWPKDAPLGSHYSITAVLPKILALLEKYNVHVTYFTEAWSLGHYGDVLARDVAGAGHEVAWHAWQHEAWGKLTGEEERANFARSFGQDGIGAWSSKLKSYRGFRPPGGLIHGNRTLSLGRDHGLGYFSPAAENAALVDVNRKDGTKDSMVILPFRWAGVDAFYYMEAFAGLRKIRGDEAEPLTEDVLIRRYVESIEQAVQKGEFISLLFHPFLSNSDSRLRVIEDVIKVLAKKRDNGQIWLATCSEVEEWVRKNPSCVGSDPEWDETTWSR